MERRRSHTSMHSATHAGRKRKILCVANSTTTTTTTTTTNSSSASTMRGIQKKKRKKKLVIRNYAVKPKVPENFLADGWKLLENAIDAIYARIPVPHTREKLYGIVEDLCMHGQSASLFARVKGKFAERVNSLVRDLSQQTGRRDTYVASPPLLSSAS